MVYPLMKAHALFHPREPILDLADLSLDLYLEARFLGDLAYRRLLQCLIGLRGAFRQTPDSFERAAAKYNFRPGFAYSIDDPAGGNDVFDPKTLARPSYHAATPPVGLLVIIIFIVIANRTDLRRPRQPLGSERLGDGGADRILDTCIGVL